ncbi:MAG TPA: flagellar basal body rod protein FlgB [Miltoncostaeaceae bacterium]|jgi:flagellar basal-body rod protein FlgB|nr:flagellar basal body rod protein FlgB [Miltoncostaeaceae bacterium]
MFPDDLTTAVLTRAMAGYSARNTAIANNIANADTPGYKRVDVSFESALAGAVDADRQRLRMDVGASISAWDGSDVTRRVDEVAANVMSTDTTTMRVDGSNVDPDDEMARLSANQLASSTVVSLLDKRFAQFRTAITGR